MNKGISISNTHILGKMQGIKDAGFDNIELSLAFDTSPITKEFVKSVIEEATQSEMKIWSVHLPFGEMKDISRHNEAVEQYKFLIDILSETGFKIAVLHLSFEPIADDERSDRIERAIQNLKEICRFSKKYNIDIAMECLPRSCLGNCSTEMEYIYNSVAKFHDNLGICFDCNHLTKESNMSFIKNTKGKIITTHFSDFDGIDEKHWYPGEGVINWKELVAALKNGGYSGPALFEVGHIFEGDYRSNLKKLYDAWKNLMA